MPPTTYDELVRQGTEDAEERVTVERRGDRAVVTLREPERLNVLSAALTLQLEQRLGELAREEAIRSIVLTGADPAFSAGGDLEMMERGIAGLADPADRAGTTTMWRWIRYRFGAVVRLIARTDKAFIAAINGPAAGVGLAFALTCDLAIASERALIVPAFGRLGLLPEVGTSWTLTRRLGYQGAFAFYASGRHLDAAAALEAGLVHEVVAHDELLATADDWCDRIGAMPPHALAMAKPLLRAVADASWDGALAMEEFAEPNCFSTAAMSDAVQAMRER